MRVVEDRAAMTLPKQCKEELIEVNSRTYESKRVGVVTVGVRVDGEREAG